MFLLLEIVLFFWFLFIFEFGFLNACFFSRDGIFHQVKLRIGTYDIVKGFLGMY